MAKSAKNASTIVAALILTCGSTVALANEPTVVAATATLTSEDEGVEFWRFDVTIQHEDTGWDHYADAYEILDEDGKVLGVRTLHHPHVEEQPFTRSINGVRIPAGAEKVFIRAHDSVHGYGEEHLELVLTRPES